MLIDFKGKSISVKEFDCQFGSLPGERISPHVNLFVKVTSGCNAHCSFCSNAGAVASKNPFDTDKLLRIIEELQSTKIRVNRVNITGGEPSIVIPLVEGILDHLSEATFSGIHVHLNTNGLLPASQELMRHPRWDSISMSLHHYSLPKLSELYGIRIPETALHFEGIDMQKINASCNLIKGYVDSPEEAGKMLDYAVELGIPRIGFVALMKVNDFCRKHFVDIDAINLESIPHVYFTKSMNRGINCKCSNYLYNKNLRVLEIYMRNYSNQYYCESSLVYDGEFLRQGFHSDNIIC